MMTRYDTRRVPCTFDSLVLEMLPRLPGANPAYARKELHSKLEELCRQTHCWIEATPAIGITAGQSTYPIPVAYDAYILCVRSVLMNGRPMRPDAFTISIGDADAPLCILRDDPARDEPDALAFDLALAPLAPCENFPDGFLERHRQTLIAGALSALQSEDGKPYSKPTEAQTNHRKWLDGIHECNVYRVTGDTTPEMSVLTARSLFI